MKCESWMDLQNLILDSEVRPLKGKIDNKEFQKKWCEAADKAKAIWEKLLLKNKKFFDKDGYIDVELQKRTYRRKKGKKGQPPKPANVVKRDRITVRLEDDLLQKLNNYCDVNKTDMNKVVRDLLKKFLG